MLTFESMISLDPAAGGFAQGGGVSAGGKGGSPSARFSEQLSGIMAEGAGDEAMTASAVSAAAGSEVAATGGAKGTSSGVVPQVGVVMDATFSSDEFMDAAMSVGVTPEGEASLETDADAPDPDGEMTDDGSAALAAGLMAVPQVVVASETATGAGGTSTVQAGSQPAGAAGAGTGDGAGQAPAGLAEGDELELPTFFPQRTKNASSADASTSQGGTGTSQGSRSQVTISEGQFKAAQAQAMAVVAGADKASEDGSATVMTSSASNTKTGETGAGAKAAVDGAASAEKVSAQVDALLKGAQAKDTAGEKVPAVGTGGAAQNAAKTAAAAAGVVAAGLAGDETADDAIISVKASRAAPAPNPSETAKPAAQAGEAALAAATAKATRTAGAQAGASDADQDASDGDDAGKARGQAASQVRGADQGTQQGAGLKPAAGGSGQAGDGDPRLTNLSSSSDMSVDGEIQDGEGEAPDIGKQQGRERARVNAPTATPAQALAATAARKADDGAGADPIDPLPMGSSMDAGASARAGDGQAVRQVQSGHGTTAALPTAMVAAEIARNAQRGVSRFEIRLDPPELGRVDVHLKINDDGKVQAHLVVERRDTLDMFMRDQRGMERALENAGLKTNSDGGLQFSLKDQGQRSAGNENGQHGTTSQQQTAQGANGEAEGADQAQMIERIAAYSRNGTGGLDIRI